MAEYQRLLLAVQPGQYVAELPGVASAHQYGIHVPVVVQRARKPRAQLAHDFGVDAAGSLVHNHQRHVVFAKLAGDGAENGLGRDVGREELVGFLNKDDQRPGFISVAAVGRLLPPHPGFVDAAGQQVADQYVSGGVPTILSKLQHHVVAALQLFDDAAGAGVPLAVVGKEGKPLPGPQPTVQRLQCREIDADFSRQIADVRGAEPHEGSQPVIPEMSGDVPGGGSRYFRQVQRFAKDLDVLGFDLVVPDAHDTIRSGSAPSGAGFVQGERDDARGKQLLQSFYLASSVVVLALPAVLALHVEHQRHRRGLFDQAGQQHPRQKGFAGSGSAEYAY